MLDPKSQSKIFVFIFAVKPVINLALDVFEQPSVYKSIETTSTIELLTGYFNKNPKRSPNHFQVCVFQSYRILSSPLH